MCPFPRIFVQLEVLTNGESTPEITFHDLQHPPCMHSTD